MKNWRLGTKVYIVVIRILYIIQGGGNAEAVSVLAEFLTNLIPTLSLEGVQVNLSYVIIFLVMTHVINSRIEKK